MSQTPSEELMASLTPGIPPMVQVGLLGWALGRDWSSVGAERCYFCLPLLSAHNLLASADSTCSQAWCFTSAASAFKTVHVSGARLASHLFPLYLQIPQRQPAGKLPSSFQSSMNSCGTSRRSHVCAVGRCITMQRSESTV